MLMTHVSFADILQLPVQERIHLVEMIWESIAAFPEAIAVSPELKSELDARLADFERNPEAGYSWEQVKEQLKTGRGVPPEVLGPCRPRSGSRERMVRG